MNVVPNPLSWRYWRVHRPGATPAVSRSETRERRGRVPVGGVPGPGSWAGRESPERGPRRGGDRQEPQLRVGWASGLRNHPDGQFARNTAATSDHSLHANSETLAPALTGYTMDSRTMEYDIDTGPSALRPSVPSSRLEQNRADRLYDQPELIVKRATATGMRTGSLLFREYTPEELAVGAVMLYAAYSAVA